MGFAPFGIGLLMGFLTLTAYALLRSRRRLRLGIVD